MTSADRKAIFRQTIPVLGNVSHEQIVSHLENRTFVADAEMFRYTVEEPQPDERQPARSTWTDRAMMDLVSVEILADRLRLNPGEMNCPVETAQANSFDLAVIDLPPVLPISNGTIGSVFSFQLRYQPNRRYTITSDAKPTGKFSPQHQTTEYLIPRVARVEVSYLDTGNRATLLNRELNPIG